MSPISQERADWCADRLRILKTMYYELSRQRQLFGAKPHEIQAAMELIQRDRLMLSLEHELLVKELAHREQAALQNLPKE